MENTIKEFKFSIVVPCYNEANAVAQTVEEISQTLKEWNNEKDTNLSFVMIFINDGSKDETSNELSKLTEKYKSLKLIDSKVNCGYGASLKKGI